MKRTLHVIAAILSGALLCQAAHAEDVATPTAQNEQPSRQALAPQRTAAVRLEKATFGLGCFSCAEAIFEQLRGVATVDPGYSGGSLKSPTYDQVSSGLSGHAEVVQITYDPRIISYDELLEVFWKIHDPTTLNRQGKDIGAHYRSAIFYHGEKQREIAKSYKQKLEASDAFADPIVTEITPFKAFYPAEKEHLDFYRLNPANQYCTAVIRPKLDKFKEVFAKKLRTSPDAVAEQP